jgi:2-oxoglutarate dehydrogenase E2 component (dihydrolipoamide succinyltransferase)
MAINIIIPSVGESVQEAVLAEWFKKDGDRVKKDEPLFVIETDKVSLEVVAEADGILTILVEEGETVAIGAKVGTIEPALAETARPAQPAQNKPVEETQQPVTHADQLQPPLEADQPVLAPSVRRLVAEKQVDVAKITGTGPGGRISKEDVLHHLTPAGIPEKQEKPPVADEPAAVFQTDLEVRKPMTPIRKRIAQRLLASKQQTAMLTTFNEIDMSRSMAIRGLYKDAFLKKHDVSLGFMSFFIKACVEALKEIPEINAFIEEDMIVYHNFQNIGVAIGSKRGLVVPVIRHAEKLGFAQIEQAILDYVKKINENRLELADLEGGTFTVSNGGVYGSLLSTPILNMPQSGILGMHKIEKRPIVIDDDIVIRPMMYVALSYDHRIVDGKGAVTFLKRVKEFVENPERMMLEV